MLKTLLIDYFGFNRQQRNGLFVLLAIIFALFLVRLSLSYFIKPSGIQMRKLQLAQLRLDSNKNEFVSTKSTTAVFASKLFYFDPNYVSYQQLLQLGFTEKKAATFIKFRERGFVFERKEDLKKIYGVTPAFYEKLAPFVRISKTEFSDPKTKTVLYSPSAQKQPQLEINSADSSQLTALPGIGPAYAKRIIKYRSLLGGFISSSQLMEVYGVSRALYGQIKDRITVDAEQIKKLDPNKDDFKTLNRHPYIGYENTKSIFNKRRQTALTTITLRDIYKDSAAYDKVLPYLQLNQ